MRYEWDTPKRLANLAKHGVDFVEAEAFDWETAMAIPDDRLDYGEARWVALGFIGDRLHVMIYTHRDDIVRIISLRKANDRERRAHEAAQA